MYNEAEVSIVVQEYLEQLGYPKSSIILGYATPHNNRVDLVIKTKNEILVVIELKSNHFQVPSNEELSYHPIVRQLQKNAEELGAKYYMLSNGIDHVWMQTGGNGRPEITVEIKYSNFDATTLSNAEFTKSILFHAFEYIRNFPITGDPLFDCSVILYFKIIQEIRKDDSLPFSLDELLGQSFAYEKRPQSYSPERTISEVLSRLRTISLLENRDAALEFIDDFFEVYRHEWNVPRWLADFMVKMLDLDRREKIIDLFTRNGTVTSAALLNKYQNLDSYYSNQKEFFWIKVQQLLGCRRELELKFEPALLQGELGIIPRDAAKGVLLAPPFNQKFDRFYRSHLAAQGIKDSNSLYLEAAFNSLQSSGRVVAVVMDGFLLSSVYTKTRNYLKSIGRVEAIISLPPETFKPYSSVKTSLLIIKKNQFNEVPNTFFASLDEVPKSYLLDASLDINIKEILTNFKQFQGQSYLNLSRKGFTVDNLDAENFHFSKYWFERQQGISMSLDSNFIPVPLKQLIVEITRGSSIVNDLKAGDIPFIGPAAIRSLSIKADELSYTSKEKLPKGNVKKVEENEVIVNIIGPYRGKAALATPEIVGLPINRHLIAIKPNLTLVVPGYLAIALNSKYVQDQFFDKSTGAVIQSLSLRSFEEIYLPIPSIEEQETIVSGYVELMNELSKIQARANTIHGEISLKLGKLGKEGGEL